MSMETRNTCILHKDLLEIFPRYLVVVTQRSFIADHPCRLRLSLSLVESIGGHQQYGNTVKKTTKICMYRKIKITKCSIGTQHSTLHTKQNIR